MKTIHELLRIEPGQPMLSSVHNRNISCMCEVDGYNARMSLTVDYIDVTDRGWREKNPILYEEGYRPKVTGAMDLSIEDCGAFFEEDQEVLISPCLEDVKPFKANLICKSWAVDGSWCTYRALF